jgi:hypothetical protein
MPDLDLQRERAVAWIWSLGEIPERRAYAAVWNVQTPKGQSLDFVSTCARWRIPVVVGTLRLVLGDEAECGARHVDQRPSGIGQSARRKAIAGSAAVTAANSSTSAVPAF